MVRKPIREKRVRAHAAVRGSSIGYTDGLLPNRPRVGYFKNPEELAYGRYQCEKRALYRVRFLQTDIWPDYTGPRQDTLDVEIYEHWLMKAGTRD